MKSYLAFDLGASSGRAILGKEENGKLCMTEVHRFPNYPYEKDGHFYWDYAHLLDEIKTGIRKAYVQEKDIASLSIDTWGVDYVFFRDGKPVRDPYNYRDSRTTAAMEKFHRDVMSRRELYDRTGIQLMVFNTIYQLYAHKQDFPEDFENGSKMLFMPDALLYSLTGEMTTEYTIASTAAMLDPEKRDWDLALLAKAGIPTSVLTPVEMPAQRKFQLSEEISRELNVPRISVIKAASHDTGSAVASTPCTADTENWAYISSGTWALLGMELDHPIRNDKSFAAPYTNEGALTGKIRFLTNIMGTWLLQETRRTWQESGRAISFAEMEKMAAEAPESPVRINPNYQEFLAPGDMPKRICDYCKRTGQEVPANDAALLRCIYTSLADCFRDSIRKLEDILGKKITVLHVLGGAIRDRFLMQLTADTAQIKVVTGPLEATAVGNILAQMIADGTVADATAARQLSADSFVDKTYLPR